MLPPNPTGQDGRQAAVTLRPPSPPPPNVTQHASPPVQFSPLAHASEMPPQGDSCGIQEVETPPPRAPNWTQHCSLAASQVDAPHGIGPMPPLPPEELDPLLPEPLLEEPAPLLLDPPLDEPVPLLPPLPLEELEPLLPPLPEELEPLPPEPLLEEPAPLLLDPPLDEPVPLLPPLPLEELEPLLPSPPLLDELAPPLLPPPEELPPSAPLLEDEPLLEEVLPLLPLELPPEELPLPVPLEDPAVSAPASPFVTAISTGTTKPSRDDRPQATMMTSPSAGGPARRRMQYAIFLRYHRIRSRHSSFLGILDSRCPARRPVPVPRYILISSGVSN
jgi:hypothetical protein